MDSQMEIYQTSDNQPHLTVKLEKDSVWLSKYQPGDLFQTEQNLYTLIFKQLK